jgi:hypothetical protein
MILIESARRIRCLAAAALVTACGTADRPPHEEDAWLRDSLIEARLLHAEERAVAALSAKYGGVVSWSAVDSTVRATPEYSLHVKRALLPGTAGAVVIERDLWDLVDDLDEGPGGYTLWLDESAGDSRILFELRCPTWIAESVLSTVPANAAEPDDSRFNRRALFVVRVDSVERLSRHSTESTGEGSSDNEVTTYTLSAVDQFRAQGQCLDVVYVSGQTD